MRQPWNRRILIFMKRIIHVAFNAVGFHNGGNCLFPNRAVGIILIHQVSIVRGDAHPENFQGFVDPRFFVCRKVDDLFKVLNGINPVPNLPTPVISLLRRNIFPKRHFIVVAHAL